MSQSSHEPRGAEHGGTPGQPAPSGEIIELVANEHARAILDAVDDEPRTAKELAGRADIALSTAYRKVDELERMGLVEERVRLRRSGHHTSVYCCPVDRVCIHLGDDDPVQVRTERGDGDGAAAGSAGTGRC